MSLVGFHEERLPVPSGFGSTSGPVWQTETLVLSSGKEVRNARWSRPQHRWDIVTPPLSAEAFEQLVSFYNARLGRLNGFRFHDPSAFSSAAPGMIVAPLDQVLGTGDGMRAEFQLVFADGGIERPVLKPVAGTVSIAVDGAELTGGWSVDTTTGELTFDVAPEPGAVLTAGFEYDWPVRFDTDALEVSFDTAGAGRVVSLPLIEIF
ncbi:TIGR02217 family protein [Henriciella barbarensis]|uniref:TIGR02217 family protein n=1 Tax=Henriciella barbarensis TaxID=86342 RepID=A0A399QS45_9PROT|nr:DUF2460 domain-containing protein [Henriciella barbarensis]RIJ20389.1 TIGR02217 family protein [Henriciella barbarensis]